MNGYKLMADSLRKAIEQKEENGINVNDAEQQIRIYDLLATFQDNDKFTAFDSGMFNDIFKGYVELLVADLEQEKIKKDLIAKANGLLDFYSSKQAEDYYYQR